MTQKTPDPLNRPAVRSALLFFNFFLIILAYYQVKPASRSLFLEYSNAGQLPYLWTASALLLLALMPFYQKLLNRMSRLNIVLGTCAVIAVLLVIFRLLLVHPNLHIAVAFYLLVDVFSVVLVEQFWSLTNSVYRSAEGRRWYGLIASGGLLGGLVGGSLASWLLSAIHLKTADLLLVSAGIIGLLVVSTLWLARHGLYEESRRDSATLLEPGNELTEGWRALRGNRYLALIAVMLLFSQMCEPIVEYQFMHLVELSYTNNDARTAFLSQFLSLLSGVALAVNLLLTPIIHRRFGTIGGLLVQPVLLGFAALTFIFQYSLWIAGAMKIADRGLSYSINRASRELLYVPADPVTIYKAKAWIDMVGYRAFKIAGNATILLLTQWLPWKFADTSLSWVVMALSGGWVVAALMIRGDYRRLGAAASQDSVPMVEGT